jgi:SAM-dependent methyltransferase
MTTTYTLSNAWERERERLAAMHRTYGAGTVRAFELCGVGPGWRCLDAGAGTGVVAEWLADRVGPTGHVVATDVDTRWLDALGRDNVEARRHDLVVEPLDGGYDLVHARLLVEHLPARDEVIAKLAGALAPGGWLVVEDLDWSTAVSDQPWPEYEAVLGAVQAAMKAGGYDGRYGLALPRAFDAVGLVDVYSAFGGEGDRATGRAAWRLLVEPFREALVGAGLVTDDVVEAFLTRLDGGDDWVLFPPVMVTVRGRRATA